MFSAGKLLLNGLLRPGAAAEAEKPPYLETLGAGTKSTKLKEGKPIWAKPLGVIPPGVIPLSAIPLGVIPPGVVIPLSAIPLSVIP